MQKDKKLKPTPHGSSLNDEVFGLFATLKRIPAEMQEERIAAEENWLIENCGFKREDLYSPEERAQRFEALLKACCNTPPLMLNPNRVKGKGKGDGKPKMIPKPVPTRDPPDVVMAKNKAQIKKTYAKKKLKRQIQGRAEQIEEASAPKKK